MRILLIGGSKSGKSRLAQELCRTLADSGPMVYWATMEPVDGEDEERIRAHVADRYGWGFTTVERGRDLPAALPELDGAATVLLDSVTAALANEMFGSRGLDADAPERLTRDLLSVSAAAAHCVCVCDDLWRDGMAYDGATQQYCRALAAVCRSLASSFDTVCEIAAGIPHVWKGEWPL